MPTPSPFEPRTGARVVFLDIDGVLAPIVDVNQYSDIDPTCMALLNELIARGGADVVVSSSYRYGRSIAELQRLLDECGFVGRVVGKTPTEARGLTRGEEIGLWLAENTIETCVILDDHRDMGELLAHLVQTKSARGLQPADVERALEVLALRRLAEV